MTHEIQELGEKLIGGIIAGNDKLRDVIEIIGEKRVFIREHQRIYNEIVELYSRKEEVNSTTLYAVVPKKLQSVVVDCMAHNDWNSVDTFARVLCEIYYKQRLTSLGKEMVQRGTSEQEDAVELVRWAEDGIFQLSKQTTRKNFVLLDEAVSAMVSRTERRAMAGYEGITTGFQPIDDILGGLEPGEFVVVAGRPSTGKTAWVIDLTDNVSRRGIAAGVFSCEMSLDQLMIRLVSKRTHINGHRMNFGKVTATEIGAMKRAQQEVKGLPLCLQEASGISIQELVASAHRMKHEHDVQIIAVDYLQLVSGGKRDSREQEIAFISRSLKGLAVDLKIPVIGVSQLSRAPDKRDDKKPILSDLRESGAIEQDADIVVFVHCEDLADRHRDMIIAKHRMGPIGEARLTFNSEYSEFV